jgi:ArsR family transcriptional regulator, arsenate/arsenite/antimonite-responsive transcriptional repressor
MTVINAPPADMTKLAEQLQVLANPKRLHIIHLLMEGVQCNCELGDFLDMTPSLISHHMRLLRQAGLVAMEKDALDGRWVYYSVNEEALQELNAAFSAFFAPQRIKPRRLTCGPQAASIRLDDTTVAHQELVGERQEA